jgi:uncharacterized protein YgbK (DUF1537 family)
MHAIRVLADDVTGACDVGAELLPWSGGVTVESGPGTAHPDHRPEAMRVRNTQSRVLPREQAVRRVALALGDVRPGWAGLVLKKIDAGLRGQIGAEIDAAMDALDAGEAFVLPAVPEVGRTTQLGRQMIGGVPLEQTPFARDPWGPIDEASVPAAIEATSRRRTALLGLAAVRQGIGAAADAARREGASIFVCDAETDADLERAVRGLLLRPRPLVLVGSTGLGRALRRVLGPEHGGRGRPSAPPAAGGAGVLVVVGSAHPAARAQVARAAERGLITPLTVSDAASGEAAGLEAGRSLRAGRPVALVAPAATAGGSPAVLAGLRRAALAALSRAQPRGLVLVGAETTYQVLEGLGLPPLWLEARLCPLVVRARLVSGPYAGLTVVTKGGANGTTDLLGAIVRQLGRGAR